MTFHKKRVAWNKGMSPKEWMTPNGYTKAYKLRVYSTGSDHPRWGRTEGDVKCLQCGKVFHIPPSYAKERKFCSRECFYAYNHSFHNSQWKGDEGLVKCIQCGKLIRVSPHEALKRKFCSYSCFKEWFRGEKVWTWKGGISREPYDEQFNAQLKDKIREKYNFHCALCNRSQQILREKLTVHHKDGNKKNSDEDNLIPMCRSCHSKIHHATRRGGNIIG
ncbi:MAG: HNH endonuclease [Candidatus Bathyarchaeota archaeon]|nr:HNH endonuclease [Candidatus Bathyarchaeota archaeon]